MKNNDKILLAVFGIASLLTIGVVAQNAQSVLYPKETETAVDIEKVKSDLSKAGLIPHDAMYWKES